MQLYETQIIVQMVSERNSKIIEASIFLATIVPMTSVT